ncbi:hypothetical protein HKX69_35110 [Streptomyces argyrophyllae]|uniref:Uncharacterized protein n=1 Tax=Streptomyces argyrophylli TaxID=2726118 RepID=A0A6M4PTT2_9ACTN|nr:hypothetical protein HKX69_35110 [Streptomyces argyrophyllae]
MRARASAEAVVASLTGRVAAPSTLLLGRYDTAGRLRFVAWTAPLSARPGGRSAACCIRAARTIPGRAVASWAGWGRREALDHRPVVLDVVVEFAGDTAVDEGRYRHPVRYLRGTRRPQRPAAASLRGLVVLSGEVGDAAGWWLAADVGVGSVVVVPVEPVGERCLSFGV